MEVEALNGRGSAGAPQDRKLDAALPRRPGDGVQGDARRILQTRDVSPLLAPDRGHVVAEQGHAERVGGVGQREEQRLDGGHATLKLTLGVIEDTFSSFHNCCLPSAITAGLHMYLYMRTMGKCARTPSGSWLRMRRSQATKVPLHDWQSMYSAASSW